MSEPAFKSLLTKAKINLIGLIGAAFLSIIRKTIKIDRIYYNKEQINWSDDGPIILAFWHSQQLMMPWIYLEPKTTTAKKSMNVLISQSQDGRFIAKAMAQLGIGSVAGSSSKGGREALVKLVQLIKSGAHIAFTPDGPKGPVNVVKVGVLKASQLTGARILPACFVSKNPWRFNSWDKMTLPKPFSKGVFVTGKPFICPRESSNEEVGQMALDLANELNRITEEGEKHLQ